MNCEHARDALLEADLAELRCEIDTPLVEHLRTCADCRGAAQRIIDAEAALAMSLAADRPQRSMDEAVSAVLSAAAPTTPRRSARRWRIAVPALAAAGLAAVLLVQGGTPPVDGPKGTRAIVTPQPLVEASAGQHVAVIETDNPNIVVVWTF